MAARTNAERRTIVAVLTGVLIDLNLCLPKRFFIPQIHLCRHFFAGLQ
jgi:hypothetical protein